MLKSLWIPSNNRDAAFQGVLKMKKHRFYNILRNAILATLVFVLFTDPILVAAKTLQKDPQSQAVDLVLQSGDLYLDSIASATVESAKLINSISVVQNTKIGQLNEAYIEDVIARALKVAEQSSIALGAVDDMADGIEQIGDDLPAGMDIGQAVAAGLPDEMRADLAAQGIPSAQIDQIDATASDLFALRGSMASGLPADIQADLLSYGFTQSEIDQIAEAASQHGLVNGNLNTRLAQFRATQDELAGARTSMVILAVQLLGYQIAVRQSNGIQPRAVTDAELDELAQDELRLLVHAAHLKALWGNDPNAEIGEGDWWFIEHYAGRAAERLQKIIVETQNRGLVTDLFLAYQMQMLAISARSGDAGYTKAELDALSALLAHRLDAVAYYQQHASPGLPELALARLAAIPSIREQITWPVSDAAIKNAKLVSRGILDSARVQDLQIVIGNFDESNETNNQGSTLIIAGFLFGSLQPQLVQPSMQLISDYTAGKYDGWFMAILTGNTDNPVLFTANIILSFIPVIGAIPDIVSLIVEHDIWIKVVSIFGIIFSLGDLAALLGFEALPIAAGSFVADAFIAVIKGFFKNSDLLVKTILNSLGMHGGFDIALDLIKTAFSRIGDTLGGTWDQVYEAISNVFTHLWGEFTAFVREAGADLLRKLGFDEGGAFAGQVLLRNLGMTMSDEMLLVMTDVGRKFASAGIEISDEITAGMGTLAKNVAPEQVATFSDELLAICGATGGLPVNYKLARPIFAGADCINRVMKIIGELDEAAQNGLKKLCSSSKMGCDDIAALAKNYSENAGLTDAFKKTLALIDSNPRIVDWTSMATADSVDKLVRFTSKYGENGATYAKNFLTRLCETDCKDLVFDEHLRRILTRLQNDEVLTKLVGQKDLPNVQEGVIKVLREVDHPNANYEYIAGWRFELERIRYYANDLISVEEVFFDPAGKKHIFDLVLRNNSLVEAKYRTMTELKNINKRKEIINQIVAQANHEPEALVIVEFASTADNITYKYLDDEGIVSAIKDALPGRTVVVDVIPYVSH